MLHFICCCCLDKFLHLYFSFSSPAPPQFLTSSHLLGLPLRSAVLKLTPSLPRILLTTSHYPGGICKTNSWCLIRRPLVALQVIRVRSIRQTNQWYSTQQTQMHRQSTHVESATRKCMIVTRQFSARVAAISGFTGSAQALRKMLFTCCELRFMQSGCATSAYQRRTFLWSKWNRDEEPKTSPNSNTSNISAVVAYLNVFFVSHSYSHSHLTSPSHITISFFFFFFFSFPPFFFSPLPPFSFSHPFLLPFFLPPFSFFHGVLSFLFISPSIHFSFSHFSICQHIYSLANFTNYSFSRLGNSIPTIKFWRPVLSPNLNINC